MASLLNFLPKIMPADSIDAVFLAGDIAFSGKEAEYVKFERAFLAPLRAMPELQHSQILAVPGNHDVDCDSAFPATWDSIRSRNQLVFFSEDETGRLTRKGRVPVFAEYMAFTSRNDIITPDPSRQVTLNHTQHTWPVDILLTNTSFFSDKDEDSSQPLTPCPMASLRAHLRPSNPTRPAILIGHHSPSSFLEIHKTPFETFLFDNGVVYLHGHEHVPKSVPTVNGTLQSLGFGAAYLAPLSAASAPPYKNTFALCELTDTLSVKCFTWDSQIGRWEDTTRSSFYAAFKEGSEQQTAVFTLPPISGRTSKGVRREPLHALPRKLIQPKSILAFTSLSNDVWLKLINLCKLIREYRGADVPALTFIADNDGKREFSLETDGARHLLVCIPGASHVLSAKEIESYNTRLDTEALASVTVVSLGRISADANVLYLRLSTRKQIEVLVNKDLAESAHSLVSALQLQFIANCDAADVTADVLLDDNSVYVLLNHAAQKPRFQVVDSFGLIVPGSDSLIVRLRQSKPSLATLPYDASEEVNVDSKQSTDFSEADYLASCFRENNALKYAALANVGLRFSDFSLDKLYIDGNAVEIESATTDRLDKVLDDHLAPYPASDVLKQQIKQLVHQRADGAERRETSRAREFCQKFGAVLLTGDPGSGKTCFVKSEILAYSRRAASAETESTTANWHSLHVPVLIQLSQAASEPDLVETDLLQIASRLLERRGFSISAKTMDELRRDGRLALFFDGLDEVVSVEKRAIVVHKINELISSSLEFGNRFVVTSRPAAVNVINLLPSLKRLELQGLNIHEVAQLARRVLSLRLAESEAGIVVDAQKATDVDSVVVKQILHDCQTKPGVSRLAQNPLLLTLLVMIYANSGAPSAKRHRIYEEAIKTLASVRGRQSGHDPVSAQDLRERLGAVALSVYRKESGILPKAKEVTETVRVAMTRQLGNHITSLDAERFVQKIAESTGLIALIENDDHRSGNKDSVVTFMHHSFMEYFAAVGLSKELDNLDFPVLMAQPRWLEILTLLAGIIGEGEDIAPVLSRIVGDGSNYGDVDGRLLIFATDCALECDVPSEASVGLLLRSADQCLRKGPARSDGWVRNEIARRFEQLVAACGISLFEDWFCRLLEDSDAEFCAVCISFVAISCSESACSSRILASFEKCCTRTDDRVLGAICDAVIRVEWLRTSLSMQVIGRCLSRTNRCRVAAFEAILAIPELTTSHWPDVINGIDDTVKSVRVLASRAAIKAGFDGDLAAATSEKKNVVANAFQVFCESSDFEADYPEGSIRRETAASLLRAASLRDKLIGIQLLPAVQESAKYVYDTLMTVLNRSEDHQEVTVALRAFRVSRDAQVLVTDADLRFFGQLSRSGTIDVRRASIMLLARFGADVQAVRELLDRDFDELSPSEFQAAIYALGRSQTEGDLVVDFLEKQVLSRIRSGRRRNESFAAELCRLLESAEKLGRNFSQEGSSAVSALVRDVRVSEDVRRGSLRAVAAIQVPNARLVEFLVDLFKNRSFQFDEQLVHTPSALARNCRQSVSFVVACVDTLVDLRNAAEGMHAILRRRHMSDDNQLMVSTLRKGIEDVSQIIVTFDEFIKDGEMVSS